MGKRSLAFLALCLVAQMVAARELSYFDDLSWFNSCDEVNGCSFDGKCYSSGDRFTPDGYCATAHCVGNNMTTQLACPLVVARNGCYISFETVGLPYPDCCGQEVCTDADDIILF